MKKFLTYCALFVLPGALLFIAMEVMVGFIPNSYSYKYKYVKENGGNIQALAIGHSQLYDGFMPEAFFLPAFNLCNSDQSYVDDYYILRELLDDMPNLKVVILPIGYVDVGVPGEEGRLTDRACFYHKYMHLDYDGRLPLKYRFECFAPRRTWDKIWMYFIEHADIVGCDSLGRRSTNYLRNRKHELGYDRILGAYTCPEHDCGKLCLRDGEFYLAQILKILQERSIAIVLVSPPYYWNCGFSRVNHEQRKFAKDFAESLCREFPVHYLDLESDPSYIYDDFFNETHLSEIGAEKFTRRLGEFVKEFVPLEDSPE